MNMMPVLSRIAKKMGKITKCKVCEEEYYGLEKSNPVGVCPRCIEKKMKEIDLKKRGSDLDDKIRKYLAGHKWKEYITKMEKERENLK